MKDDVAGLKPSRGRGKGCLQRLLTGGDTWGKEGREGIPAKEKICVGGERGHLRSHRWFGLASVQGDGAVRQGCVWQGWVSRELECQARGLDFT